MNMKFDMPRLCYRRISLVGSKDESTDEKFSPLRGEKFLPVPYDNSVAQYFKFLCATLAQRPGRWKSANKRLRTTQVVGCRHRLSEFFGSAFMSKLGYYLVQKFYIKVMFFKNKLLTVAHAQQQK
jgi:hypothetical protein